MAKKKSESDRYINIHELDYLKLIEASMILEALKIAGIEKMPIYNAVKGILDDGRVELHLRPIQKRYK